MTVKSFLSRFKKKDTDVQVSTDGDIVELIEKNKLYFCQLESTWTNKPLTEVEREIDLGLQINAANLAQEFQIFTGASILMIPPKYEFWTYLLIALNLVQLGYDVTFLYHSWSRDIIKAIQPNLKFLKYQGINFSEIEKFDFISAANSKILNFSESIKGIPNTIPSFSTALITPDCDLDYVFAYILESTFSFAGLKKSSLKRVIVDNKLKDEFRTKLLQRLISVDIKNNSKIKSRKLRQQIHELISDGISEGADLVLGASDYENDEYANVILENVDKDMRIYQKKFFGPVLLFSYIDFEDDSTLRKFLSQQPSRGIVIFGNETTIPQQVCDSLKDKYQLVFRPVTGESDYISILENYPSLELLLRFLKENK